MSSNLLIIKLGALGDVIQSLGPMAAIRNHHEKDNITLLTTEAFVGFTAATGFVDTIWVDARPSAFRVKSWLKLRNRLREAKFWRVYDLQTSDRSNWYFRLLGPGERPEWSGTAPGCSHPHTNPDRDKMHSLDRQREQLAMAGVHEVPAPTLDWVPALGELDPGGDLVILAPGGSIHRPGKRWPIEYFSALAQNFVKIGLRPILVGDLKDVDLMATIRSNVESAVDFAGKTTLLQLAGLCRRARLAVGNDTGPMHMAVAARVPSLVLFSEVSDPALCGQRGPAVKILRRSNLADLPLEEVWTAAVNLIARGS